MSIEQTNENDCLKDITVKLFSDLKQQSHSLLNCVCKLSIYIYIYIL